MQGATFPSIFHVTNSWILSQDGVRNTSPTPLMIPTSQCTDHHLQRSTVTSTRMKSSSYRHPFGLTTDQSSKHMVQTLRAKKKLHSVCCGMQSSWCATQGIRSAHGAPSLLSLSLLSPFPKLCFCVGTSGSAEDRTGQPWKSLFWIKPK